MVECGVRLEQILQQASNQLPAFVRTRNDWNQRELNHSWLYHTVSRHKFQFSNRVKSVLPTGEIPQRELESIVSQ